MSKPIAVSPPYLQFAIVRPLAGVALATLALFALAGLGQHIRAGHTDDDGPLRATDNRLARVYTVDQAAHSVRVLNVRNGVSEIASLRIARGSHINSIRLDGSGNWLFVDTDAGRFGVDTQNLAVRSDPAQMASQSEPQAVLRTN